MVTYKGGGILQVVHVARKAWEEMLDKPGGPDWVEQAIEAKQAYDLAVRQEAVFLQLHDHFKAEYMAEREAAYRAKKAELEGKSRSELAVLCGLDAKKTRQTRDWMLDTLLFSAVGHVEQVHRRVKRVWDGLTDSQKAGYEPWR